MCIDGFRGTTKKYKPNLTIGDVVFCYVYGMYDGLIELSCVTMDDNKNWSTNETYFGPLSNGFLTQLPLQHVQSYVNTVNIMFRLYNEELEVLRGLKYEIVLGFNGRVWIGNTSNELKLKISRFIKLSHNLNQQQLKQLFKHIF
uniref:K Homology domain-containing protein n=1 Tax=Theileria parva TaxID=5875 RepID=Q4N0S0_THEPA|eukprot:XP_763056.1 hypothetical protein [Theileria parva strain Muguga]